MDTMQLGLIFNKNMEFSRSQQMELKFEIANIMSPNGNMFCDVLEFGTTSNKIIIKVSYPRYFYSNNAYLVESNEECKTVQRTLAKELYKAFSSDLESISVERIDIPFTFLMNQDDRFTNYNNVYKLAAMVFNKRYPNSISKSIINTITENRETIIYSDSKTISSYNKKVMIYDQYLNLETKLGYHSQEFHNTTRDFPELSQRIRIEVSSRIKRKKFRLEEFERYDFFGEYSSKFKTFLLKNLFNLDTLESIYKELSEDLSVKLIKDRR